MPVQTVLHKEGKVNKMILQQKKATSPLEVIWLSFRSYWYDFDTGYSPSGFSGSGSGVAT